jgi:hypothetical protein
MCAPREAGCPLLLVCLPPPPPHPPFLSLSLSLPPSPCVSVPSSVVCLCLSVFVNYLQPSHPRKHHPNITHTLTQRLMLRYHNPTVQRQNRLHPSRLNTPSLPSLPSLPLAPTLLSAHPPSSVYGDANKPRFAYEPYSFAPPGRG